ncbi:MAG TPA: class I SAM-dependent methyltransferase [Actinomycetota bacterium]
MSTGDARSTLRSEFERAAAGFDERTRGRFDNLGVVEFAQLSGGETVAEIGAGTGNFLSLFQVRASRLVAVDLVPGMLVHARERLPAADVVVADGASLPLRSGSVDLVASAQALHHVRHPLPVVAEMRRVAGRAGRVLVVDQAATEHFEEAVAMTELELVRDPSHAASRPPSAFRIMFQAAGLRIVDERVVEDERRLSKWMWPGEFPPERIDAVRTFIEARGHETGMDFERDGDDWVFTRRRMMILAEDARNDADSSGRI